MVLHRWTFARGVGLVAAQIQAIPHYKAAVQAAVTQREPCQFQVGRFWASLLAKAAFRIRLHLPMVSVVRAEIRPMLWRLVAPVAACRACFLRQL